MSWDLIEWHFNNFKDAAYITWLIFKSQVEVRKQQHKPRNDCFQIMEHSRNQEINFLDICLFTHVLQFYLVGFFSICQNLV